MERYFYTMDEPVDSHIVPHQIEESAITDKQLENVSFDFDELKLTIDFENILSTPDKVLLDEVVDGLIYESWISRRRDELDNVTDKFIETGFVYQDINFDLSIQHQMSFKGAYDLRQYLTFPYTVKGIGPHYLSIVDGDAFTAFILGAFGHIETQIQTGWLIKDALNGLTLVELKSFVDPRL